MDSISVITVAGFGFSALLYCTFGVILDFLNEITKDE